ncbi:MAG: hypothetical protein HY720_32480 [Planctomycetes bacterium]|nr:hypothetical protein [Planctomycetota bacterium]
MDATFDLAGLDAGTVSLSASVTTGGDTLASSPETTALFTVGIEPSSVTVTQGEPITSLAIRVTGISDPSQLFSAGYRFVNAVTGADVASGDLALASFAPDGLGNVIATPTFQLPAAFTGTATLTVTIGVLAFDLLGNRIVESAVAVGMVTVQPAGVVPLLVTFVTASGATFDAGTRADIEFTVQTSDPSTTSAFFTVLDASRLAAASGTAALTAVDATHMRGVASWAVPAAAAGDFTVVVLAQRGMEQVTATLPITVSPVVAVTVAFVEAGPILATAGTPSTVRFAVRGLASLAGVSLTATLTESTTGDLLSAAVLSSDILAAQPDGSFTGEYTFTFPPETTTQPLNARLTLAVLVNGGAVANAEIAVLVEPVSVPIAVTIVSAPAEARAGDSVPLTVGVAGVTVSQVSALSWSLLDAAGSTVATENILPSLLGPANNHLEATVSMSLSTAVPSGDYTLAVVLETTTGALATASQPMRILPAVTMRITRADGAIVEGEEEVVEAVLRPQVPAGEASWTFLSPLGGVAPGFPGGLVPANEFMPIVDVDGVPAWLLRIRFTVAAGTVAQSTQVRLQIHATDPVGRTLALVETPFVVQPVFGVRVTSAQPGTTLPGMRVRLTGLGFAPVAGDNVVVTSFAGSQERLPVDSVSSDGTSLTFLLPVFHPVGQGMVRVDVVGIGASNPVPIVVLGLVEALDSWRTNILRAAESVRATPEAKARLARAFRFYRDEVLVKLWTGEFGGRFDRIATMLREVRREIVSAAEAGADVGSLPEQLSLVESLLWGLPEVRDATVDPPPRLPLTQGSRREYRVVLRGPGEREVPLVAFPPFAKPQLWRVRDERGRAKTTILSVEELRFSTECLIARPSRIVGKVAFVSTLPGAGVLPLGTTVPFGFELRQDPPTQPPRGVPISAKPGTWISIKRGFEGPQPGQGPVLGAQWLPRGDTQDESRRGNLIELHVWWVMGAPGVEPQEDPDPGKEPPPGREPPRRIRVFLENPTRWKGVAGNVGRGTRIDMGFESDLNPAWELIRIEEGLGITVRTKAPVPDKLHVPLYLSSFDFAGSCVVWAQADDADRTIPEDELRIPRDADGDLLPDAREKAMKKGRFHFDPSDAVSFEKSGVEDAGVDVDMFPEAEGEPKAGVFGDGLTAFEEYRGFVIGGDHIRTSDFDRQLFVNLDDVRLPVSRDEPELRDGPADLSFVATFLPLEKHLWKITDREWDNEIRRRINFNNEGTPAWLAAQRALRLMDAPALRPDNRGEPEDNLGRVYIAVVDTGPDGLCETARSPDDVHLFGEHSGDKHGMPSRIAIDFTGQDGHGATYQQQIDLRLAGDDTINGTTVTTGPNGVREMVPEVQGDEVKIKFNEGEPYAPNIEAGTNGVPETTANGNDQQLQAVLKFEGQRYPLGTPNEVYELRIDVTNIASDEMTSNDIQKWTRWVIAHEIGHAIHIEHTERLGVPRSVMMPFADKLDVPDTWLPSSQREIRLHVKHTQSP